MDEVEEEPASINENVTKDEYIDDDEDNQPMKKKLKRFHASVEKNNMEAGT